MFIHIIIIFKFIVSKELQNHSNPAILSFPVENRDGMRVEKGHSLVLGQTLLLTVHQIKWTNTLVLKVLYYLAPFGTFDFVSQPSLQQSVTFYPLHLPCSFSHWILLHVSSLRVMPFLPILSTFWNNTHSQGLPQFTKSWLLLAFFSSCVRKASLLFRHAIRCVWVEAVF